MTAAVATADRSLASAYRWMWVAIGFAFLAFGVGAGWDRVWHVTHPFEDFWSPPHLFIYSTNAIATVVLGWIAISPALRRPFGPPLRVPLLGIELPGAILLAGGGFAVIAIAGLVDSIWHTRFGLDETAWSLPHSMLGSGILLSILGFISLRLALGEHRPVSRWFLSMFGLVALTTFVGVLSGPLDNFRTLAEARAVGNIPVLANDPNYRHIVRIETVWDLTRSNPLFAPLSALAVGIGLAFLRRLVGATWLFLLVAAIATLLATDRREVALFRPRVQPADWLPIPYLAPALAVALLARWERGAWFAGGILYALLVGAWWPSGPLVLTAPFFMLLGAILGERLHGLVARPNASLFSLLLGLGVLVPIATGALDLFMRSRTP